MGTLGSAQVYCSFPFSDQPHHKGLLEIRQYVLGALTDPDLFSSHQGPA